MTTSLFIPTIPKHIKYLCRLLRSIKVGTIQPDEIIISISDYNSCDKEMINYIENKYKDIIIIKNDKPLNSGPNRQLSKIYCNSDIIIYHDSDDISHPQRIEIIKYFFENYDILHLNHACSRDDEINEFVNIEIKNIKITKSDVIYKKYFPNNNINDCLKITNSYGSEFLSKGEHSCCGPMAIKKEVLNIIKWKDRLELKHSPDWNDLLYKGAEDYEFCMDVLFNLKKSMIINPKIYVYYR